MKKFLFFAKSYFLLPGFILILTGSCQKSNRHEKRTVPLNAQFQTSTTLLNPGSPGVGEQIRVDGTGSGTPIGNATTLQYSEVDQSVSPEVITGVDTITAQNGDKIFSVINGHSPGPDGEGNFQVNNEETITGGTGVFAGATGNIAVTVKGNFSLPTAPATYVGTITF